MCASLRPSMASDIFGRGHPNPLSVITVCRLVTNASRRAERMGPYPPVRDLRRSMALLLLIPIWNAKHKKHELRLFVTQGYDVTIRSRNRNPQRVRENHGGQDFIRQIVGRPFGQAAGRWFRVDLH
ncbi:hypothetical protein MARHY1719 [Marinobacter nauticus ATCC 49840]|nr:hypothetical protein MARHY1719 [Marinobacter nauticus ATCC 49840]